MKLSGIRSRLVYVFGIFAIFTGGVLGLYIMLVYTPQASVSTTVIHLIMLTLFLAVTGGFLVFFTGTGIIRPMNELKELIDNTEPGKSLKKAKQVREDETGDLLHSLNKMTERFEDVLKALANERDRMTLVLSSMGDGIIVVDGNGVINTINRTAEKIFGLESNTVKGMSFIEAVRDYELEKPVKRCLKTKAQQQEYIDFHARGLYLGLIVTPLISEPGCLILIQDLSRLKKLEIIRRDFVANISHELRTPVASIKLLSETLIDGKVDDEQVSCEFINRIHNETERLGRIVDGMSALARIESGQAKLKKKPADITIIINRVAELLSPRANSKRIKINLDIQTENTVVLTDAVQLEQVVFNILDNAIKFTPNDGSINIVVSAEPSFLVVKISDSGEGIAPLDLPRIFERFYTSDKSRSNSGTGLGLAISKHIIEAHSGAIWAESKSGAGCSVFFSLPL